MSAPVVIRVAEQGADDERTEDVTLLLRRQLEEVDGLDVVRLTAGNAPEGTRGVDLVVVGALLGSAADLATVMGPMVAAIRQWLARTPQVPRSVRIEVGGDALQLSNATPEQEDRLVDLFVARHTTAS
jgi:hypothetical protein